MVTSYIYPEPKKLVDRWWDLKSILPQQLGEAMIAWSKKGSGFPSSYTYEEWSSAIRDHGESLLEYVNMDLVGDDPTEEQINKAKEALRWCADHLDHLWD